MTRNYLLDYGIASVPVEVDLVLETGKSIEDAYLYVEAVTLVDGALNLPLNLDPDTLNAIAEYFSYEGDTLSEMYESYQQGRADYLYDMMMDR